MEKPNARPFASGPDASHSTRWVWVLTIGSLLVVFLGLLLPRPRTSPIASDSTNTAKQAALAQAAGTRRPHWSRGVSGAALTPGQIVAGKVTQYNWPAQKLLDYGDATLGSLQPGMVYVGGTDPGRGIPTLLNETSDGERRIVITQNGLADENRQLVADFESAHPSKDPAAVWKLTYSAAAAGQAPHP